MVIFEIRTSLELLKPLDAKYKCLDFRTEYTKPQTILCIGYAKPNKIKDFEYFPICMQNYLHMCVYTHTVASSNKYTITSIFTYLSVTLI